MAILLKSRSEIKAAKERIRLPELWQILGLPGEPPTRDGVKFASPLRPDAHPSCSFYDECKRMMDWSAGKNYDAIEFLAQALSLKNAEGIRRFIEIANGRPVTVAPVPVIRCQAKAKERRPDLSGLRKATLWEVAEVSASRNISAGAVELSQDLGTLRVGDVCGLLSWVILDESGLCAEGRCINRTPYPEIKTEKIQLGERKAHTLRGSQKNWPVGILPAVSYRKAFDVVALVEGGPDYLAALHFGLALKRTGVLPVTLLGRCQGRHGLHPDSLQYLQGMRVRIFPHHDADNGSYENAQILARKLEQLKCEVDFFVFEGLRKTDGSPIKDLNDCVEVAPEHAGRLEELFP